MLSKQIDCKKNSRGKEKNILENITFHKDSKCTEVGGQMTAALGSEWRERANMG